MIHVLIAEDHLMVRSGIRALLEKAGDLLVMGEAATGQEAIEMAERLKPDVLVMDIMMPRLNGIQAALRMRDLKLPVRIVLLSMYADECLVLQAIQCGVYGYVLKSSVSEELLWAIRSAARNETFLSWPISSIVEKGQLYLKSLITSNNPLSLLSPREREILQMVAEGHTSNEISRTLLISEKTVEKHRSRLMKKLQVRNLAGLVRKAVKYGLVDREP